MGILSGGKLLCILGIQVVALPETPEPGLFYWFWASSLGFEYFYLIKLIHRPSTNKQ